jgi:hypothetical protein
MKNILTQGDRTGEEGMRKIRNHPRKPIMFKSSRLF